MATLLSVAIALILGLMMTRVFKRFKLPAVTSYLVAGVIVGPFCLGQLNIGGLGFVSADAVSSLSLVSEVALGFIAFSIGNEFRLKDLKAIGKQAAIVGVAQALVAAVLVDIALVIVHLALPDKLTLAQAITLGAIATATAPAATLMVVRQYKAKGPLTDILLPIVALDDAVGLIVFAVSFGIAKTLVSGEIDLVSIIVNPILEIVLSLVLGAVVGFVLTQVEKIFNSHSNRLNITIGFVLLTAALAMIKFRIGPVHIGFSSLLTCMMMGTVFCNTCPLSEDLMEASDKWTSPLFCLFFVVSGAQLELSVFRDPWIILIGVIYIAVRSFGKYFGARTSSKASGCSSNIQTYLGITLLPQAGVALGMCATAMALGEQGVLIRNITLFAILVYEIVGPMMTKWALTKAGDITPMSEEVKNRRQRRLEELRLAEEAEAAAAEFAGTEDFLADGFRLAGMHDRKRTGRTRS